MANSNIVAGHILDEVHFQLKASLVKDYVSVVDDQSQLYRSTELVPPMAVASLGVRMLLQGLDLPPGAIHVAQELTTHRAASQGQQVSCRAQVAQSSQRRDGLFLVLQFTVSDEVGQPILDGRTMLMVPAQGR